MPNSPIQPVVIRCPHVVLCVSVPICKAFGAVKTEVLKADLCPEARSKRHATETAKRFKQASEQATATNNAFDTPADGLWWAKGDVEVDTHFEVEGDEIE